MFNIKSIVKQITERSRDSNPESPGRVSGEDIGNSQKAEGFLCPKCMKQFSSPWELQSHYESVHDDLFSSGAESGIGAFGSLSINTDGKEHLTLQQDGKAVEDLNPQSSLSVEDVPLLTDVADLQERLCQTLNRKAVLESRIVQLVQTNVSLKATVEDLDRNMTALQERHKVVEAQLAHRESIDDTAVLRQELVQVQRMMDETNRERENERDALQAELQHLKDEQDAILQERLETSLRDKKNECKMLTEEIKEWKEKHDKILNELNEETPKMCASCGEKIATNSKNQVKEQGHSEQELLELQKTVQNLQLEHENLCSALQTVNSEKHNLKLELSRRDQEIEDIRSKFSDSENKLNKMSQDIERREDTITHLQKEHTALERQLKDKERWLEEKLLIEKQLCESQKECTSLRTKMSEVHQTLAELQHEHNSLQEEHNEELKKLHETIHTKSESLQKQEAAVHLLVEERADLAQRLELVETTKAQELKETIQQVEKLKIDLAAKEESWRVVESNLCSEKEKCHSLQEELDKVKEMSVATLQGKNEEIKCLQASLDAMTGEKLALEAQLETTGAEQQKLLETCYTATSEVEVLQNTVSELRRKWEESEAALQELGRENATLQLDIEKLLGRKWAEDADVSNCTLCNRDFTMLLRKHHCRNCGQIFCNECSSKTAAVVSNKKPVRVCDSCYSELTSK